MSYQAIIINAKGAKLRTAPNLGGGEIEPVTQGEVFDIDRLVYSTSQPFNTTYIPEFWAALHAKTLRGDVWAQLKGLRTYQGQPVTAYVAVRVAMVMYSTIVGAEDIVSGGVNALQERQIRADEVDRVIRFLAARRAELEYGT